MYVYRIEHSEYNNGPYSIATPLGHIEVVGLELQKLVALREKLLDKHHNDETHPGAKNDIFGFIPWSEIVTGFDSIGKLLSWFDGYLDILYDCGYVIRVFEVAEKDILTSTSGKQIGFNRILHNPIEEISLMELTGA
jgi:hypothetical protein